MKKVAIIAVILNALFFLASAQRDESPRRLEDPADRELPSGARIEFREFPAASLQGRTAQYSVFLPPSYSDGQRRFPVVYFLHGLWNDHTSWVVERYGNIPERLEALMQSGDVPEFILVQPNAENSFYTDYLDGSLRFEQMIAKDLIEEVEKNFRARTEAEARSIGGVSMGGYGALKIAIKYPENYNTVAVLSPIVLLGEDPSRYILSSDSRMGRYLASALEPIYGMPFDPEHWKANSLVHLAEQVRPSALNILIGYGTADRYNNVFPMEQGVRTLSGILEKRGIEHELRIYKEGPHGWQLVVEHLSEVIEYLTQTFE